MKTRRVAADVLAVAAVLLATADARAQRQMEHLTRGVVAVNQGGGKVYVGWRLFGTDAAEIAFNVYRATAGAAAVRVNKEPIKDSTNFVDSGVKQDVVNGYFVRPVLGGAEQGPSAAFSLKPNAPPYISIPLRPGLVPNDASVGDLDGDGEYDIVLKREDTPRDNAHKGITGETHLEAYKLDGTFLWRINLGKNIRSGAHYTQFMVYDLDGDGRAEVACKTADGTVDGQGKVIGDPKANYVSPNGYVLSGPEYFTIFDGKTGAELATTNYIPPRGRVADWGDNYGNRVDRFLACVAYLDGQRPSVVMCRGYYTRTVLVAWDWRDGKLTRRWTFDSDEEKDGEKGTGPICAKHPPGRPGRLDLSPFPSGNRAYRGQGNHNLAVADVDGDGKDEIIYGACAIDHDGRGLYSTGLGHGDAMHVGDLDPDRPGLEVFQGHEKPSAVAGSEFRDARTGKLIWGKPSTGDVGRALCADIDPRYPGEECWVSGGARGLFGCRGELISKIMPPSCNFAVWWDGDLLRELLNRNTIDKWDWQSGRAVRLLTAEGCSSNNGTKATPCLSADLFGDWREEVIWRTTDNKELRIYTTTTPTQHRIYTLMHDPQYRLAIAWQNVAYNQPPHPGFFLGDGMKPPPRPNIRLVQAKIGP